MHLALFFTRGVSLEAWDSVGMLDREVAIYERLRDHGFSVSFVTYGDTHDLGYRDRLQGINLLCNRWGFPSRVYQRFLHLLHGKSLMACDLIKTNQTNGADIAMRAAKFWRKPFIARCGYMWSVHASNRKSITESAHARSTENEVFNNANSVVVTTKEMADYILLNYDPPFEKLKVIPNYVETERFVPDSEQSEDFDVIFVGRLALQKNVSAFLTALSDLDVRALIIGDGELCGRLQSEYGDMNGKVRWEGNVPNSRLPSLMNRSRIFVLPSHYEGHPKTLIEAMSCGMPVIGADSPGIREIIHHGVNGLLCGTDSKSIRRSLQELLDNPGLADSLGKNARQYVLEHFSLDRVFEMEYQLYKEVLNERESHAY
jgi:glycosyltransferase involved in cell wall biosynthesis